MCGGKVTAFLWVVVLFSATAVVRAEMVHHWQFEGNSNDSVGGWNGTGGIGFAPGKIGQAASFGGTAASDITFTFDTAGLKNITVAFWMKLDPSWVATKAGIGRIMGSADNFEAVLGTSAGGNGLIANNFYIAGGTYPTTTTAPAPDTWYHVAMTSSLSTAGGTGRAEVWVNGVLEAFNNTVAANDWVSGSFAFGQRVGGGGYRLPGLLDDIRVYNTVLAAGEIAAVMQGGGPRASSASPADRATDVVRDVILSWEPAESAQTHDVYFDTAFDGVDNASRTAPMGVLVSQGQDANSYDPAGLLVLGQTYYWRIDEVDASSTVTKGNIWSFTVEPYAYPIKPVAATASSAEAGMGPERTIDGSGLSGDLHGTETTTMWLSAGASSTWIQYEFDRVYKLYDLKVWNANQSIEALLGLGARSVTIETSVDGTTWAALDDVPEFAQAPGMAGYAANTTVSFGGILAKYVRLTINASWGGVGAVGLSEVRFSYVRVQAFEPQPADGATGVSVETDLSWRAGREAALHQVYVSADQQAVVDGTAAAVEALEPHYQVSLDLGRSYYWKVVEVNESETPTSWEGEVWSFTTANFVAVEDFESYTDDKGNRIYETWIDGYGTTTNGSQVGYIQTPFAETTIIHGGKQSMPLSYNNTGGMTMSETTRTFASPQDWTKHGVTTLVLYFYGDPANPAGQIYVKLNGTKVVYSGVANALKTPYWTQWNIDLASAGANLKAITKLAIGVEGSGQGMVYVDDILLYGAAPKPSEEMVWIEAESGTITNPLGIYDDPTASGGKYIGTENLGVTGAHVDGVAKYPFTVKGGIYEIWGHVIDQPTGRNSFWVRVQGAGIDVTPDADGWVSWNFPNGAAWHWDNVRNGTAAGTDPVVHFTLAAGTYTLEIAYREDGARLDAIVITDAAD